MFWIIVGALIFFFYGIPLILWLFGLSVYIMTRKGFWQLTGGLLLLVGAVVAASYINSPKSSNNDVNVIQNEFTQPNYQTLAAQYGGNNKYLSMDVVKNIISQSSNTEPKTIINWLLANNYSLECYGQTKDYQASAKVDGNNPNLLISNSVYDLCSKTSLNNPSNYFSSQVIDGIGNSVPPALSAICNSQYKTVAETSPTGNKITLTQSGYLIDILPNQNNEIILTCQK